MVFRGGRLRDTPSRWCETETALRRRPVGPKTIAPLSQLTSPSGYSRQIGLLLATAAIRRIADPGEGSVRFLGFRRLYPQVWAIRKGVPSVAYLRNILERMVKGHPINRIDDLLPWNHASPLAKAAWSSTPQARGRRDTLTKGLTRSRACRDGA